MVSAPVRNGGANFGVWCTWEGEHLDRANSEVPESAPVPDAVDFARERLGFQADELQARLLRSGAKRGILNCTRQWGKSTVTAIAAVYRASFREESLVVVASPTERQSGEFLKKAAGLLGKMGVRPRGDGTNTLSLLLPNGSRIVGLPGTERTVRGFSAVSLLVIDEAARVEDAMYQALRPMLAVSDGDLWMMSTPNGRRGFFYENWAEGGDEWERVAVTAAECPRISASFLEEERRRQGSDWVRQEYFCEFIEDGGQMFSRDLVRGALDDSLEPLEFRRGG